MRYFVVQWTNLLASREDFCARIAMPSPGPEQEQSRDVTGQTYRFDVHIKLFVPHGPPPADARRQFSYPELSAAVIQKMESIPALLSSKAVVNPVSPPPTIRTVVSRRRAAGSRATAQPVNWPAASKQTRARTISDGSRAILSQEQ